MSSSAPEAWGYRTHCIAETFWRDVADVDIGSGKCYMGGFHFGILRCIVNHEQRVVNKIMRVGW